MNILIVMPKVVTRTDEWYVFQMGVAYVSSALKNSGICNVFTFNLNTAENAVEKLCDLIDTHQIDAVATGGLSVQYHAVREVIAAAKQHKPGIITMVGGGFITSSPEVGMTAIPQIDIGMIGEGEITICELADALQGNRPLNTVKGIIYRTEHGMLKQTPRREVNKDLDSIAFPDYDGFDFASTLKHAPVNYGIYNKRAAVLITSRGCPFNCTFCFHPQGDNYRSRSLDNVFAELDYLVERYNIKSVLILDELFGGNNHRLQEFCRRIEKYNLQWWVETRVQFATEENLRMMKKSGCVQILLGIENVNNSILESMKKHITVEEIECALENAYRVGISAPGVLIFGDPAETDETAEITIRWWKEHPQYNIVLTTVQVYPGSQIWDYAINKGLLPTLEDQVRHVEMGCPKLNLTNLPDERFSELCKQIGLLNQSRPVYIGDATISNENWEKGTMTADVSGKCARCNTANLWPGVNILGEGGGMEAFICCKCGQSHANSFQKMFFGDVVNRMKWICDNYGKVALWGQGRKLVKIFEEYPEIRKLPLFYMDNSPAKQGKQFYGLRIHAPEDLVQEKPDVLILAVGDASVVRVSDKAQEITAMYTDAHKTRIIRLIDMMNPDFQNLLQTENRHGLC